MADVVAGSDKVRKLGRGLSALLQTPVRVDLPGKGGGEVSVVAEVVGGGGLEMVEVGAISPSRFQARRVFDEATLKGLAESIRRDGVMQPVILRPITGGFELVAGERRWRAAKMAGLARVPAIVREMSDEQSAEWGLVENVQREDLNPMDRATGLRMMQERFGLTHGQIAERVGLERATVTNLVRLTELEDEIAELLAGGALTSAHGKSLLAAAPGAGRVALAKRAHAESWSVRRLDAAIAAGVREIEAREKKETIRGDGGGRSAIVLDLERRLSQQLGTKVEISMKNSKKGTIIIEFYGLDHFDGLAAKMGLK